MIPCWDETVNNVVINSGAGGPKSSNCRLMEAEENKTAWSEQNRQKIRTNQGKTKMNRTNRGMRNR